MKKIKIVLTGGPSGGKTTLIETLQKDSNGKISVVPEAASILYRGGFPRRSSANGKIHAQKAICSVQRELEELVCSESSTQLVVCDRGSLDSIAYWPGSAEDFFRTLGTTENIELARYDWVLHLDTATQESFDTSNPIRTESHLEALELNNKIKIAWQNHNQRIVISHESDFLSKISKAKSVIKAIESGLDYSTILKSISNL